MSKEKLHPKAVPASLSCSKCNCSTFRIIVFCGGHVDLACSSCGSVIDHNDIKTEHTLKVHGGEQCPECSH